MKTRNELDDIRRHTEPAGQRKTIRVALAVAALVAALVVALLVLIQRPDASPAPAPATPVTTVEYYGAPAD